MSSTHDTRALHRIDLNLLVAFDALARERNVTRAAERAGVTQSAMSHTLRRLREQFGDPLFVRARGGVALTPRAESLVEPVRSGLIELLRAIEQPVTFDPATARRVFRLVSPDLFDMLVLPPLLRRLGSQAPGVDLAVAPMPSTGFDEALATGELDLAVVPVLLDSESYDIGAEPAGHLQRRILFRDRLCCFARAGHAVVRDGEPLSLDDYTSLAHLLVSPTGAGPGLVDRSLERDGRTRRVALRVPHFASALAIAAASDLVLTGPASLALTAEPGRVASTELPVEVPGHAIAMVWHPRFGNEPGQGWLREVMIEVTAGLTSTGVEGVDSG